MENESRFIFNPEDVKFQPKKEITDTIIEEVSIGQYVRLKNTNQIVKVIEHPFISNGNVLSDYLGLEEETGKKLLFNQSNIESIVNNNSTKKI
ncbi:MAG: hypothetical protein IJH20_02455 [Bacilli bacterium]|nr:hypothetical protein [Bacilli bacterium]